MKHKTRLGAFALAALSGTVAMAEGGPDFSSMATEVTTAANAVNTVVGGAIIAGFSIFVLIWGARKIKSGIGAGA